MNTADLAKDAAYMETMARAMDVIDPERKRIEPHVSTKKTIKGVSA